MSAYYNEIDPVAAQWIRNLIAAGHIAPGDVDERSIEDVRPDELHGYVQCHFFAGVAVWSYALRRAGWPDDRPVWTGSCPCQPFSSAGKGAGFADLRHLWPAFHHLIRERRPAIVFGEQVASRDGLGWLDLVQTDLEKAGYTFGAVDLCSAGVGAPHIRQRLWFVAQRLDHSDRSGLERHAGHDFTAGWQGSSGSVAQTSLFDGMADAENIGRERQLLRAGPRLPANRNAQVGNAGGLADAIVQQRQDRQHAICNVNDSPRWVESAAATSGLCSDMRPGATTGFWRDADWLLCRDGKWRPVEPGTFPLAHGASGRVGRLRAYGNAINAEAAATFIRCAANID